MGDLLWSPRRRVAMWNTLENVFYLAILLLFLSTFLPKRIRVRVRESLGELWRVLPHLWRALEPYAYRLVTGMDAPADDGHPTSYDRRRTAEAATDRRSATSRLAAATGDQSTDEPRTEPFDTAESRAAHQEAEDRANANVRAS